MSERIPAEIDVLVIGAGPAGLAAATQLRSCGVASVVVLEREAVAGGVPRHCGHYPFGWREYRRLWKGPRYARALVESAEAAGVVICTGVTVHALQPGPRVSVSNSEGAVVVTPRLVLLCTGAREATRASRLIGGTKPAGVLSTGALQSLVYLNGQAPFRRPVIVGTELVSFSAILTCRHLGIQPAAMIEQGGRTTARWPTGVFPRLSGVPLLLNTRLLSIHGAQHVSGVLIADQHGEQRRIDTDGVIVSGRFRPDVAVMQGSHLTICSATGGPEIDQYARCSDPAYFAAGNVLRAVETAGWSWQEGQSVAHVMAAALRNELPPATATCIGLSGGDILQYVVPQRIAGGGEPSGEAERAKGGGGMPGGLSRLQLRVSRPVRGQIEVHVQGSCVYTQAIQSRPERRITVPVSAIPADARSSVNLHVVETKR